MSVPPWRDRPRTSAESPDQVLRWLHEVGIEAGRILGTRASVWPLRRLAVRREDVVEDRYTVISAGHALYVFLGSAPARGLVHTAWGSHLRLRPDRVYVRMDDGVFATSFRSSLADLRQRLPAYFEPVHQSVLVNLDRVSVIDTTVNKVNRIGVAVGDGSTEWLRMSRRSFADIRRTLGLPQRRARRTR